MRGARPTPSLVPVRHVTTAIRRSIVPKKASAWHRNIHHYFTKQPANVVGEYIQHFTNPGDVVLDPFLGSGVTALAGVELGRRVIGVDLSEFACFLSKETVRGPINVSALAAALDEIAQAPFETTTVGEYLDSIFKLSDASRRKLPIPYWYPKGVKCPPDSDFDVVEEMFDRAQLVAYSVLLHHIKAVEDEATRGQLMLALSATMARANLTYNMSTTRGVGRTGDGGAAIFAQYRYWKPKTFVVLNVWDRYTWRVKETITAKKKWNALLRGRTAFDSCEIHEGSATDLKMVHDNSVDYIGFEPTASERAQEVICAPYGGSVKKWLLRHHAAARRVSGVHLVAVGVFVALVTGP